MDNLQERINRVYELDRLNLANKDCPNCDPAYGICFECSLTDNDFRNAAPEMVQLIRDMADRIKELEEGDSRLRRALEFYTRKPVRDYDEQGRRRTTFVRADNAYVAEMTLAGHDLFTPAPLTEADIERAQELIEQFDTPKDINQQTKGGE